MRARILRSHHSTSRECGSEKRPRKTAPVPSSRSITFSISFCGNPSTPARDSTPNGPQCCVQPPTNANNASSFDRTLNSIFQRAHFSSLIVAADLRQRDQRLQSIVQFFSITHVRPRFPADFFNRAGVKTPNLGEHTLRQNTTHLDSACPSFLERR